MILKAKDHMFSITLVIFPHRLVLLLALIRLKDMTLCLSFLEQIWQTKSNKKQCAFYFIIIIFIYFLIFFFSFNTRSLDTTLTYHLCFRLPKVDMLLTMLLPRPKLAIQVVFWIIIPKLDFHVLVLEMI